MTQMRQRLLSERETATLLNVSPSSLQKRRQRGLPPIFIKIGKRIGYDPRDVDDLIENSRVFPETHEGCI